MKAYTTITSLIIVTLLLTSSSYTLEQYKILRKLNPDLANGLLNAIND